MQARQRWARVGGAVRTHPAGKRRARCASARRRTSSRNCAPPAFRPSKWTASRRASLFAIGALPDAMLLFDPRAGAIRAHETAVDARRAHRRGAAPGRCQLDRGRRRLGLTRDVRWSPPQPSLRGLRRGRDRRAGAPARPRGSSAAPGPPAAGVSCSGPRHAAVAVLRDRTRAAGEVVYALDDLGGRYAIGLADVFAYPAIEDLASDLPSGVDVSAQRERIIAYVRRVLVGLDPEPVGEVFRLTTTLPDCPDDGYRSGARGLSSRSRPEPVQVRAGRRRAARSRRDRAPSRGQYSSRYSCRFPVGDVIGEPL